ncbi:MAG: class I SAM-dependent methyltransferase [Alphaproteobacteria bacterium]|nr:class I SAM-dependent methyltransferase [Alphaproteobacteria bacterium]
MAQDRRAVAFQDFILDCKIRWMTQVHPALCAEYRTLKGKRTVTTAAQAGRILAASGLFPFYQWFERHIQRQKISGRWGMATFTAAERARLEARMAEAERSGLLQLDPSVAVPDYYAAIDTHQIPGNLTTDSLAGIVYKRIAASTQPPNTERYTLHERFAEFAAERDDFHHIVDLGCGFGKSTITLAQKFHAANVEGVDISAPCLRVAAAEAAEAQMRNLRYQQRDARRTGLKSGDYDLVTSTMVLHEMRPEDVRDTIDESFRLLAPGGTSIHLDFRVADPLLAFLHATHGRRNNEPYMAAINAMDVVGAHRKAGFTEIEVVPFAEADGATDPDFETWRLPWIAFIARKGNVAPKARAKAAGSGRGRDRR